MNGGLCSEGDGSFLCHCKPGFKGKSCEGKSKKTFYTPKLTDVVLIFNIVEVFTKYLKNTTLLTWEKW